MDVGLEVGEEVGVVVIPPAVAEDMAVVELDVFDDEVEDDEELDEDDDAAEMLKYVDVAHMDSSGLMAAR